MHGRTDAEMLHSPGRCGKRLAAGRFLCLAAATFVAAIALLIAGCARSATSPADPPNCSGVTLTPGPCNEAWSLGPEPVVPESRCPTAAEVAQVQREIPVRVQSDATEGVVECRAEDGSVDLTPARAAMYRGLLFMRRVRFDAPLPWTSQTLYDWLRASIPKGVVVIAEGNSHACSTCPGPVYIHWSAQRSAVGMEVLGAASIIVHEARHTNDIEHTCESLPGVGNVSDRTIAEMGSLGVDYYLRLWIAEHSDEHPDTREYARRRAVGLRTTFCCECPQRAAAAAPATWLAFLLRRPVAQPAPPCGGASPRLTSAVDGAGRRR